MSGPALRIVYKDGRAPVEIEFPEDTDPFRILNRLFSRGPQAHGAPSAFQADPLSGSTPAARSTAPVAQPAERGARNSDVAGSRPAGGSTPPGARDTSMVAYRKIDASGKLGLQERLILQQFLKNPERGFTRNEVSAATGIRINSCTARINKLITPPHDALKEVTQRQCNITREKCWELRLNA